MKNPIACTILATAILSAILFTSCRKKKNAPEESQGTSFQHLLKTVTTTTYSPYPETTEYSYTAGGLVSKLITRGTDYTNNTPYVNTELFYRTASGRIDSVVWKAEVNGALKNRRHTWFYYQPSGQPAYSIQLDENGYSIIPTPILDSSVYEYSGARLTKRTDYRRAGTNPYLLLRTFTYNYDASGNMNALAASYTSPGTTDTVKLTFDNKVNPLPVLRNRDEVGYWGPGFYDDYSFVNNPLSRKARDWSDLLYEYRYSANNKPLYQKVKEAGTTSYAEVLFYYD